MKSNFSAHFLLQELENLASQLGIEVRYENLRDEELSFHSGACKLFSRSLIIIDARCLASARSRLLARELSKYDLENFYIVPRVREYIALHSSGLEKNLPQI